MLKLIAGHAHFASLYSDKMSSPEIALFLREQYDSHYFPEVESPSTIAFGPTLYRKEEDPHYHTPLKEMMANYSRAEIKRFFGFTLDEWLDLTLFEATTFLEQAELMKSELSKMMEEVKTETTQNMTGVALPGTDLEKEMLGEYE